jgi:hypothetical protein
MLLAGVGIYGLPAWWIASREPEIAVRLPLGAPPVRIFRWRTLRAFRLTAAGVALGLCGGWAAAVVLALGAAAAAIPAWRASRVDAARRAEVRLSAPALHPLAVRGWPANAPRGFSARPMPV